MLQQVALLTSVASPESLNTLAEEGAHLQESICAAKELTVLRRKQADSLNNAEDPEREGLNSQGSTVQRTPDLPPIRPNLSDTEHPQGQFLSSSHKTEDSTANIVSNNIPKIGIFVSGLIKSNINFKHSPCWTSPIIFCTLLSIVPIGIQLL